MRDAAIETFELTKQYDQRPFFRRTQGGQTAVYPLNLRVEPGELFGLLGPNGAGKTTLVKMLCTLVLPSGGTAQVAGYGLDNGSAIRAAVGLVSSDERSFYWRLSAQRNLDFFAAMHGLRGATARQRVAAVLQDVGLEGVGERPFAQFSSGMKQRLAIARGLLHQPRLLFLDEPSRSLDPTATHNLHLLIQRLRREQAMTIFLITHDLAEAEKLCDRVGLLHQGKLQTVGRPADLRRQLWTQRQYSIVVSGKKTAVLSTLASLLPNAEASEPAAGQTQLSFWAEEDGGRLTAVLDHLRHHQHHIYTIEATPPSLEAVFQRFTAGEQGSREAEENFLPCSPTPLPPI